LGHSPRPDIGEGLRCPSPDLIPEGHLDCQVLRAPQCINPALRGSSCSLSLACAGPHKIANSKYKALLVYSCSRAALQQEHGLYLLTFVLVSVSAAASIHIYFEGRNFSLTGRGTKLPPEGLNSEARRAERARVGFLGRGREPPPLPTS